MQLLANLKPVPKNDGGKRQRSEIVASRVQAPGQGRSTVSRSGPALAAAWLQHVVASTGEDVAGVAGDRCGDDIDDDLAGAEHRVGQRSGQRLSWRPRGARCSNTTAPAPNSREVFAASPSGFCKRSNQREREPARTFQVVKGRRKEPRAQARKGAELPALRRMPSRRRDTRLYPARRYV